MSNQNKTKKPVRWSILLNGIIKQNPVLVLLLGTCPTLAITTSALNGLGMGLAATFVLIGSNTVISLLKRIIPAQVRIPSYIVVIASFVTVLDMLMEAFVQPLYEALGVFLPLIVVNCIVLGRAEMFASKNGVFESLLDGAGMGLGFTATLVTMGTIRELLGRGTWFGLQIFPADAEMIGLFATPAGGFLVFGCLIALVGVLTKGKAPVRKGFDCAHCPSASLCSASYKCVLPEEPVAEGEHINPLLQDDTFDPNAVQTAEVEPPKPLDESMPAFDAPARPEDAPDSAEQPGKDGEDR